LAAEAAQHAFHMPHSKVTELPHHNALCAGHPPIFLSEGEYFGELGALVGGARTNDVIAYTHCLIYSLDHQTLVEIFVNNPRSIELLIDVRRAFQLSRCSIAARPLCISFTPPCAFRDLATGHVKIHQF
jgi:CRP-like cAMP-binding protein